MTDIFETAAVRAAGLRADGKLAAILAGRADILAMTRQAEDAALAPATPGGLSHAMRAALCCRMARLDREAALAAHYETLMTAAGAAPDIARLADPDFDGGADSRTAAILRHVDLVTTDARSVVAADIEALTAAGVSEDDIVRLSELVAFASYQIRLAVGLRLLGEAS